VLDLLLVGEISGMCYSQVCGDKETINNCLSVMQSLCILDHSNISVEYCIFIVTFLFIAAPKQCGILSMVQNGA